MCNGSNHPAILHNYCKILLRYAVFHYVNTDPDEDCYATCWSLLMFGNVKCRICIHKKKTTVYLGFSEKTCPSQLRIKQLTHWNGHYTPNNYRIFISVHLQVCKISIQKQFDLWTSIKGQWSNILVDCKGGHCSPFFVCLLPCLFMVKKHDGEIIK